MSKRDRQGVRTPSQLEQKYNFGSAMTGLEATTKNQGMQITRQNQTLEALIKTSNDQYTSLEKDMVSAKKDIVSIEKDVVLLQKRMTNAESRDNEMSQPINRLAQSVSRLETTVKGLSTRLGTAESTLADLVERVAALDTSTESGG